MESNKNSEIIVQANEDDEILKAHAMVYSHLVSYSETLALRSAIELRIADIIHSHGQPMNISQISSKLESSPSTPDVTCLARVMRILVRKKIFIIEGDNDEAGEAKYGLTTVSKWLLHDHELNLAPLFLFLTSHTTVKPWYEVASSIKEGGKNPFERAHGESIWEYASKDHEFSNAMNVGMAAATKLTLDAVIKGYKEGFSKLEGTLVDVGGGIGKLVAKIVEVYPHIKGINFDLPQTISNAPQYPGVTHVGGDAFQEIPSCDNTIIKGDGVFGIILKGVSFRN